VTVTLTKKEEEESVATKIKSWSRGWRCFGSTLLQGHWREMGPEWRLDWKEPQHTNGDGDISLPWTWCKR